MSELIYDCLREDYPKYADKLLNICIEIDDSGEKSLFSDHINLAIDCFDKDRSKFSIQLTHSLVSVYSYLAASLFCLDAIVDGHSIGKKQILQHSDIAKALTLFQAGGFTRLRKYASLAKLNLEDVERRVIFLFYNNSLALDDEDENRRILDNPDPRTDYANIIGRSYLSLFLFEIVAMTCGQEMSLQFVNILKEIIYFVQLSDDIGDWKIDFESGGYTPFLKQVLSKIEGEVSMQKLKEFVYLKGVYESELAKIVIGFDEIYGNITSLNLNTTSLAEYVRYQREETKKWLVGFLDEKKSFINYLN